MSLTRRCPECNPFEFPDAPTVFVVDDDPSVSTGPAECGSFGCGLSCTPASHPPSYLLAELRLPGLTGLDLQRLMFDRKEMPIIFMGEQIDLAIAIPAMKAGALEVLTKPLVTDVSLSALGQ